MTAVDYLPGWRQSARRRILPSRRAPLLALLLALAVAGLRAQTPPEPPAAPAASAPAGEVPPTVNPLTGDESPPPAAPKKKIAAIKVRGAYRLGRDMVLGLLPFKVGDVYDVEAVKDNYQSLLKRNMFDDLRVEAEHGPDGVTLIYTMREIPILHDVFIENIKEMTQGQALDKLKENHLEIQTGVPVDYERIKRAEEGLRQMLSGAGRQDAQIRSKFDPLPSGEVNVVFTVVEGAQTRIRDIHITGNHLFTERELRGALKDIRRKWLFSGLSGKNKFSSGKLEQALDHWREMYEASGYIDYEVGEAEIEPAYEKYKTKKKVRTLKTRYVDITLRITEGPRFTLGDIAFADNKLFSDDELRKMFPGYRPSPWAKRPFLKHVDFLVRPLRHFFFPDRKLEGRLINKPLLKQFGKGIENRYGNKGYIYANAGLQFKRHEAVEGQPRIADITYAISEDREYYLKRLEFDGNTKTYDRTLRREFNLMEGDLFKNDQYQTGLYKIQQLALFDLGETPKIEKVPDEPGQVQVRVAGKEARHDELQVGGGYSGASGGSFNFSFATRNLGGTGNSLNAQASLGTRQSLYSATLYNPWFFDRHIGASFTLTNTRSNLASYTQRTRGAGLGVVFPQGPFSSYRVNYNFQKINASNFATAVGASSPTVGTINTTQSSMTLGWNFDSRNDIYRANRGGMFSASLAYSGGILGGKTNQWTPTLETTYYYSPFRKQTFAMHLAATYVAAFAGDKIQSYQRLFTGGEFSLRAFPLNGVAPYTAEGREFIDPKTSIIEGGNRSYTLNLEYVYHVADPLDVAIFYDMGQVYHEKQTTDLLRSLRDIGFELRFYIPAIQAPLRMFWARNLTPRNCATPRLCDQSTVFQFTIGQTF